MIHIRETNAANPSALGFINSGNTASYNDLAWIRALITSGNAKGSLSFVTRNSDDSNSGVAERMRIQHDGNVGIGTLSPDAKLTVAGKIHSQEVKVTVSAGADFVFDNDYKLKSLDETEQYFLANKHLPEITPAKEMKKNGIELGEMNIKLLQKIEELTLHLINQNKKSRVQEEKMERQDDLIKRLSDRLDILLQQFKK